MYLPWQSQVLCQPVHPNQSPNGGSVVLCTTLAGFLICSHHNYHCSKRSFNNVVLFHYIVIEGFYRRTVSEVSNVGNL